MNGSRQERPAALEVTLNGDVTSLTGVASVAQLVASLGLDPRLVAVEHNGSIVPRGEYESTGLASGDRIELVRFVQGG